eukprot:5790968-Prymnesium_polylepis.2
MRDLNPRSGHASAMRVDVTLNRGQERRSRRGISNVLRYRRAVPPLAPARVSRAMFVCRASS